MHEYYVNPTPNPSGAHGNPQSRPFDGAVRLTEEQMEIFLAHNGFVEISDGPDGEVSLTPKTALWENWKASNPPDRVTVPKSLESRVEALERSVQELLNWKIGRTGGDGT